MRELKGKLYLPISPPYLPYISQVVLKGELKGKRKETRSVALSAGEACNYEPLDRQLMITLRSLMRAMNREAKSAAARREIRGDIGEIWGRCGGDIGAPAARGVHLPEGAHAP